MKIHWLGIVSFSAILGVSLGWTSISSEKKDAVAKASPPKASGDLVVKRLLHDPSLQALGEKIFFDQTLSNPSGMACATCHDAKAGWTGPDSAINEKSGIYPGAVSARFGNRKPSSAAYATQAPQLHTRLEDGEVLFVGGNFWDGRATGQLLGNAAADQAVQPFLNTLEHNLKDGAEVVSLIEKGKYAQDFADVCQRLGCDEGLSAAEKNQIKVGYVGLAIAAFENSSKVNAFTSKYDAYLKGRAKLSPSEKRGLKLFEVKGKCADCHPNQLGPKGELPLFTDFTYDNLGIPANPQNPWYGMDPSINPAGRQWVDEGLGAFLRTQPQYAAYAQANLGKHRVPTLRNIDKRPDAGFVKRYGHNGYFPDLESILHFYNTRDTRPFIKGIKGVDASGAWPKPEVLLNMNKDEMGNLKLTEQDEKDILAFLRTLNDGYSVPVKPRA